jgi:hypothetical protein
MSNAHAPLDVPVHDVLPGHVLSEPRLIDYAVAEQVMERQWAATMLAAAATAGEAVLRQATEYVGDSLKRRHFAYGRPAFDDHIAADTMLPTLLYVCLRVREPGTTPELAQSLITADNYATVKKEVLRLFGYKLGQAPKKDDAGKTTNLQSISPPSSAPSASPASPSPTSLG